MSVLVSSWVWKHSSAAGSALLVLLAVADIADDDGYAYPGFPWLARKTRLADRTVRRQVSDLQTSGSIAIEPRSGRRNLIRIIMGDPGQIGQGDPGQNDPGQNDTPVIHDADPGQVLHSLLIPTHQDTIGQTKGQGQVKRSTDDLFEIFWKSYPRRVKKQQAFVAFAKALKRAEFDAIMAGLMVYVRSVAGKDPEFIAHATSWLNGSRWEDEQPSAAPVDPYANRRQFGGRNA